MRVRRARTRARVGASERDERAQRESERDGQREEAESLTRSVGSGKMGAVRFGEADGDDTAEREAVRWGRAKQAGEEEALRAAVANSDGEARQWPPLDPDPDRERGGEGIFCGRGVGGVGGVGVRW